MHQDYKKVLFSFKKGNDVESLQIFQTYKYKPSRQSYLVPWCKQSKILVEDDIAEILSFLFYSNPSWVRNFIQITFS